MPLYSLRMLRFYVYLCIFKEAGEATSDKARGIHRIFIISLLYVSVESVISWPVLYLG